MVFGVPRREQQRVQFMQRQTQLATVRCGHCGVQGGGRRQVVVPGVVDPATAPGEILRDDLADPA